MPWVTIMTVPPINRRGGSHDLLADWLLFVPVSVFGCSMQSRWQKDTKGHRGRIKASKRRELHRDGPDKAAVFRPRESGPKRAPICIIALSNLLPWGERVGVHAVRESQKIALPGVLAVEVSTVFLQALLPRLVQAAVEIVAHWRGGTPLPDSRTEAVSSSPFVISRPHG
jgi:hypothetical protein